MNARWFGMLAVVTAVSGCSGNLGGGQSTLPGTPQNTNPQSAVQAAPTTTPNSASGVATLGAGAGPQELPIIDGWSGNIAFGTPSAAPSASPNARATDPPGAGVVSSASVGLTASVVEPTDAPHFSSVTKHHGGRHDPTTPTALFYLTLLATTDVSFSALPRITVNIPREIASKYRNDVFALALFDPETDSKAYRLGAAQRDLNVSTVATNVPIVPSAAAHPTPSPTVTPTALPFGAYPGQSALTPPPLATSAPGSVLPPQQMGFYPTAMRLTLRENRPTVFALYVVAPPSPTPSSSPRSSPVASAQPNPSPTLTASASPSMSSSPGSQR